MEAKDLLKNLEDDLLKIEKDLIEAEKEGAELSGRYFLIVDLQEGINISGKFNTEFLVNAVGRLFETLKKRDKDAGRNLLAMPCMQSLEENEEKKEAD